MKRRSFFSKGNQSVLGMLARETGKENKGRNRILTAAVAICMITLTMVFGISLGKVKAEYIREVRAAGTTASVCIESAGGSLYQKVVSLPYIKKAGRSVSVGSVDFQEKQICSLKLLDQSAWNSIVKPAYTDIHGKYPQASQEIMLSADTLKKMGIHKPEEGMKLALTVNIGLFRTEQEEFSLCGWFTDYEENRGNMGIGYISDAKYREWGYRIEDKADIVLCPLDHMDWNTVEKHLYEDLSDSENIKLTAQNSFAYDAVNRFVGSYGMAFLGTVVILCGMFFLIHNVMQLSMASDVRQMGLLNTLGTTAAQLRGIYLRQILVALFRGGIAGILLSALLLKMVVPGILGEQYLKSFGGGKELEIFHPAVLVMATLFAELLTLWAAFGVIRRTVRLSSVESMHYVGMGSQRKIRDKSVRIQYGKRSENQELLYIAWQNITRNKRRFLFTVLSLFVGVMAFLGAVVITDGSDYAHAIEKRPDFVIAGKFSSWGQEEGYGNEYKTRDAGEDPMFTEGNDFSLLYDNAYDEFSPISQEVREQLLNLDGVNQNKSYVMEGAYVYPVISRKGIRPLISRDETEKGKHSDSEMVEGADPEVVQILSSREIKILEKYVKEKNLDIDIESLKNGSGVLILHDHKISPVGEKEAGESIGEPVYFKSMWTKSQWNLWNSLSDKERDSGEIMEKMKKRSSEEFRLCGYLDNRAEDFPHISQTWHGSEGQMYFLISEKGFQKLPTEKKTLYMELKAQEKKEPQLRKKIQEILLEENKRRAELAGTDPDNRAGEAGIFCISRSDLLIQAASYIQGSRMILGSISIVLLMAGLTNYFNVMFTGILARQKELKVMESIGMTKKQKKKLFAVEGLYYCLFTGFLMLTAGSMILRLAGIYMEKQLSYFIFHYPAGWMLTVMLCLAGISVLISELAQKKGDFLDI